MTNRARTGQIYDVVVPAALPPRVAERPLPLREVYAGYAGYVWNTLRRLGAADVDLEDLTHDVFVQVQRHLADFDGTRPMKPWLFCFAFRVMSTYRRGKRRRPEGPHEPPDAVDPAPLADERLAAEQDRRLVIAALGAIDPERRPVFVLYAIDEVPMDEVARALGIPVNTAYSRLRVAREEFRAGVTRLRRLRGGAR
jgi:RNA polymerase sigma-70 factor (ECF subfamily)